MDFVRLPAKLSASWDAFLAHLWGAYAIPVALSGVHRPS